VEAYYALTMSDDFLKRLNAVMKRLWPIWNFIFGEKASPYTLGLIAAALFWRTDTRFPREEGLLASAITLGAIFAGFLATTKAIIMSLTHEVRQRLEKSNYMNDLAFFLGQAIYLAVIFCLVSLAGYFVADRGRVFGSAWIGCGVAMILSFRRITRLILLVLRHTSVPPSSSGQQAPP
jgi:hypothetical protein